MKTTIKKTFLSLLFLPFSLHYETLCETIKVTPFYDTDRINFVYSFTPACQLSFKDRDFKLEGVFTNEIPLSNLSYDFVKAVESTFKFCSPFYYYGEEKIYYKKDIKKMNMKMNFICEYIKSYNIFYFKDSTFSLYTLKVHAMFIKNDCLYIIFNAYRR